MRTELENTFDPQIIKYLRIQANTENNNNL